MKRSAHALLRAGLLALALVVAGSPRSAAAQTDTSVTPPAGDVAIPKPSGFMNDLANVLVEDDHARLEGFLDQVHRKTGAEFGVLIVQTTAPLTPTEYKTRVFDAWKLGKRGEDNGLLMLVALDEHEVRFETGYGLEGALPDGLQSRIFRREMAPRFQQGDVAGGIREGVLQCAAIIAKEKGVTLEWDGRPLRYGQARDRSKAGMLVALVIFLVVVFVLMRAQNMGGPGGGSVMRRRRRYGSWFDGGGGGWGGGFGGGGFGGGGFGGGGSFGGGGGGSFGGFGGGSSGGGGGGGKW